MHVVKRREIWFLRRLKLHYWLRHIYLYHSDCHLTLHSVTTTTILCSEKFGTAVPFRYIYICLKLIYDRRSVGQYVLVSGSRMEPMTRFLFSFWLLQVSWCGASSLTRRWVCNLLVQLLLSLARAVILGFKSRRTHDHILLSHLRLPQPGGPGPCIYIPQEQGSPVILPGTGFHFRRLLRLAGKYSNPPAHRKLSLLCSWLLAEPSLSNGYCIIAYFAVLAYNRGYMP
jgi:hypothetical protein